MKYYLKVKDCSMYYILVNNNLNTSRWSSSRKLKSLMNIHLVRYVFNFLQEQKLDYKIKICPNNEILY